MTDIPPMAGKSVLVTGGTGGIGKATPSRSPHWAPGSASPAAMRRALRRPRGEAAAPADTTGTA